jgi:hypothetical protein
MSPALYVLSEGEHDERFYKRLCERLSGLSFQQINEFRYKPGDNWMTVFRYARLLINRWAHVESPQDILLLISMDNDRAPKHPGGRTYPRALPTQDQRKESRFLKVKTMVEEKLGANPSQRAVQAVIALPVEMIESWLLLLLDSGRDEDSLPPFSNADSKSARDYYGKNPPPQLKDESEALRRERKKDPFDHFYDAADTGDLDRLAAVSPSFALFRKDV